MRMSCSLIIASALLLPVQAVAQTGGVGSGGVGGSGSGTAGVTTGTATGTGSTTGSGGTTTGTGAPSVQMPGPPGVNAAGTAQSSGSRTTGSASTNSDVDAKIRAEDSQIDKKIKGICRGC